MQYYYQSNIDSSTQQFELNEEESNHAIKVLRHGNGDMLNILNGKGVKFHAKIVEAHPKRTLLDIIDFIEEDPIHPEIHVALSLIKSRDRIEWFVEKAIETGASELSFFTSNQSEKKGLNEERLIKVAISALKQSGNTWLPKINPLISFDKLIQLEQSGMKFIAYCPVKQRKHLKHAYKHGENAIVLIGPEGDFSEAEIQLAKDAGYTEVSLGKTRLRAETAALVSLLTLKLENTPKIHEE